MGGALAGVLALLGPAVPAAAAQEPLDPDLLAACQRAGLAVERAPVCRDVVTAVQLVQPELGLLLAGGNPVLGTASPLGTRFRLIPRLHIGGRISFVGVELPELLDRPGGRRSFTAAMPQLDVSVGLFDGIELAPTLGGFASVELVGSVGTMILPGGAGFRNDAGGVGVGARVGLLRESFTAPGVSLSGEYQWAGRVRYADVAGGADAAFGFDMKVASFRAGVSKSFVALGLALTLAWDRYRSDVDFVVADAGGAPVTIVPESAPVELTGERWSAFVDVSYIVLFVHFVAEVGWQEVQRLSTSSGEELESGKLFGAIGLRLSL